MAATIEGVQYYDPPSTCNKKDEHACEPCATDFPPIRIQQTSDIHLYTGAVSDEEAAATLASFAEDTQSHLRWLRGKLKTHGNELLSRWEKKDERKRRACLPENLERRKYPYVNFLHHDKPWPEKRDAWRRGLLLPQFSAEGLLEDSSRLLRLLHNRCTHDPWEFGRLDLLMLEHIARDGFLERHFNSHCVDLNDPAVYGTLVPFNALAVHWREIAGYPTASLVLEAQNNLMKALRAIVQNILKGSREQDGTGDKEWQHRAALDFKHPQDDVETAKTPTAAMSFSIIDIFHGAPTGGNIDRWSHGLQHRRALWESKMTALQIDSDAMHDRVTQLTSPLHSFPILGSGLWLSVMEDTRRWAHLSRRVWETDYTSAVDLFQLERLTRDVRTSSQRLALGQTSDDGDQIGGQTPALSTEYAQARQALGSAFVDAYTHASESLFEHLINHGEFEACYDFSEVDIENPLLEHISLSEDVRTLDVLRKTLEEAPLTWALPQLAGVTIGGASDYLLPELVTVCLDALKTPREAEAALVELVKQNELLMTLIDHMAMLCTAEWQYLPCRPSDGIFGSPEALQNAATHGTVEFSIVIDDDLDRPSLSDVEGNTALRTIQWTPNLSQHCSNEETGSGSAVVRGTYLRAFMIAKMVAVGAKWTKKAALLESRKRLREFWDTVRNARVPWYPKEQWGIPAAVEPEDEPEALGEQENAGEKNSAPHDQDEPEDQDDGDGGVPVEASPSKTETTADADSYSDVEMQDADDHWSTRQPDPNRVAEIIWEKYQTRLLMQDQTSKYGNAAKAAEALAELEDQEATSKPRHCPWTPETHSPITPEGTSSISPSKRKREKDAKNVSDLTSPNKRKKSQEQEPTQQQKLAQQQTLAQQQRPTRQQKPKIDIPKPLKLGSRPASGPGDFLDSPFGNNFTPEPRTQSYTPRGESKREKKERLRAEAAERTAADNPQEQEPEAQPAPDLPANSIPVSRKNYRVWAYCSPSDSGDEASGTTIRWADLLNAFSEAGIGSDSRGGVQFRFRFPGNDLLPLGKFTFHKCHRMVIIWSRRC